MLLIEVFPELIKHDLKKNRGRRLKQIVRSASARANPARRTVYTGPEALPITVAQPGDLGQFSGMV